ncbi:ABC transporter substrate-binding protein [Thiospirochaeta perfilievii]|uniref:ABC transporter substrate-binding protein n=1 Tax=Thiospirochaeta perfilievii TaxID=252967 RepID=UPI00165A0928|nr:ABC transporter substrate-binding protein [Thiospirochaeta perfilievii]
MKGKVIIAGLILSLGLFLTFLIVINNRKKIEGEINLVINSSNSKYDNFSENILKSYSYKSDKRVKITTSVKNESNYLGYINKSFLLENSEDIFYTVFSSQLYNSLREKSGLRYFDNYITEDLVKPFYTLSMDSSSYFYIPITWSPWGIYYNKEIFKEYNLKEPSTLDELDTLCAKMLDYNITPFSMLQDLKWPITAWFDYLNIRLNGIQFHKNLLNGLIEFTDQRVLQTYERLYLLINKGYFYFDDSIEWTEMLKQIDSRETAMVLGGAFYYENASEKLKKNLGWFPFPLVDVGESYNEIISSSGFVGKTVAGVNEDVFEDFYKYALSEGGQNIVVNYSNLYPINEKSLNKLNREDLNKAYTHIKNSTSLTSSFERNSNETIIQPLKWSISSLFNISDKEEIKVILSKLEEIRISSLKLE